MFCRVFNLLHVFVRIPKGSLLKVLGIRASPFTLGPVQCCLVVYEEIAPDTKSHMYQFKEIQCENISLDYKKLHSLSLSLVSSSLLKRSFILELLLVDSSK